MFEAVVSQNHQIRSESTIVNAAAAPPNPHVGLVLKQAHEQLLQLLQQRADLMKRIGTLRQTITGLANLFGNSALGEDLLDLVAVAREKRSHAGFTNTCRMVLMEAARPMNAREMCDRIREKVPPVLAHHRDPVASVTTVMNRLVSYGEAEAVTTNGRRAWRWIAEHGSR